ncbi:hypothetical protein [Salinactinospora qingdaonensis]|uniref:Uncharacterized protein n=1 Tax=Salinactinospora qingdaonensis TaxID=702744 RepID=A0ABP7FIP3_9ACTN
MSARIMVGCELSLLAPKPGFFGTYRQMAHTLFEVDQSELVARSRELRGWALERLAEGRCPHGFYEAQFFRVAEEDDLVEIEPGFEARDELRCEPILWNGEEEVSVEPWVSSVLG